MTASNLGEQLIFLISPPRSGSTMLQHMLESHSAIQGLPEPHVLPPLKFLGYYEQVSRADYDAVNCSLALHEFVEHLPGGENDYLDALRAYVLHLYDRARSIGGEGKRYFLDKTPMNVLHWRFMVKLFPKAKYIILARHPVAILDSIARTFYDGDYAHLMDDAYTPAPYVQRIAEFMRSKAVPFHFVKYETLLESPDDQARAMLEFLGLEMEDTVVEYGRVKHVTGSMGDPMTVTSRKRPDPKLAYRWAAALAAAPNDRRLAEQVINELDADDVAIFGYDKDKLLDPIDQADPSERVKIERVGGTGFRFRRRVYFILRQWTKWQPFRKFLEKTRYYCDVILRD